MSMNPRIRKPLLSLSVIECSNLEAIKMEHCMKEVLVKTKPKDSFTLVVSNSSANIQTTFYPPLYLQANRNYELAMVNLETYYSFANIREGDNNSFK